MPDSFERSSVEAVIADYSDARSRLDTLTSTAAEIAARLRALAHGLSTHPERVVVGATAEPLEVRGGWEVVTRESYPSVDHLHRLTEDIREAAARAQGLRERLILLGRSDVVAPRDGFFL